MRFAIVHLSIQKGGVNSFLLSLQKGLEKLGHSSFILDEKNILRLRETNYDFVLLNSFSESNRTIYISTIGFLDYYRIPYAVLLHDYWPICHQTNLIDFSKGCKQCELGQSGQCDPLFCKFSNNTQKLYSNDKNFNVKIPLLYYDLINKNVVCFSNKSTEIYKQAGFNRVFTINHGVDTDKFNIINKEKEFTVLFTNAWGQKDIKGYKHWKWLKKNINNINFKQTIGNTSYDRMSDFYNSGSCLLFLSLWQETFGLVVIEAMACGLPIISYPVGIAPEIIDGQNGILIDSYNPKDVKDAIYKIKENMNNETREYCRDKILNQYTIEHMAKGYVDLVNNIR